MAEDTLRPVGVTPNATETEEGTPTDHTWWGNYKAFGLHDLSMTARAVVESDASFIVQNGIPQPDDAEWPRSRIRTGIVVGSVQSGKTASMLAVSAMLLDGGLDVLILLAGSRIALWRQTYERLLTQFDGSTAETEHERVSARVLIPSAYALLLGDRPTSKEYLAAAECVVPEALAERRPIIAVIPKQEQHLLDLSRHLERWFDGLGREAEQRPMHMVILDDEADDGSVLDARQSKTIPKRIQRLWTGRRQHNETFRANLYATYIAYTATPQANFLQESHNPLAPKHFCVALRTPYKSGPVVGAGLNEVTFAEPRGVKRYYCGGEVFYMEASGRAGDFCVTERFPDREDAVDFAEHILQVRSVTDRLVEDGLRAFLVAAAMRLIRARHVNQALSLSEAYSERGIAEDQLDRLPKPHNMLVHPSASQAVHAREARRILLWSHGLDPDDPQSPSELPTGELWLDCDGLALKLEANEEMWRSWVVKYAQTADTLADLPGGNTYNLPTVDEWPRIRATLIDEIFPHVRLRIINSDVSSDDRPLFEAVRRSDGHYNPPPDLCTVFVSGNVMSRGLTIKGLCTSVFVRQANEPAADTQMQMQRWFGYRGSQLPYCRLMCFEDQRTLFRQYHEHDLAMRREILKSMSDGTFKNPRVVLEGSRSLATAKIPTTKLPLSPGRKPSVRILEAGPYAEHNAAVLADLLDAHEYAPIRVRDTTRGIMFRETFSLLFVAEVLESLRYEHHDPDVALDPKFNRWLSLEAQLDLTDTERPLFRAPGRQPGLPAVQPNSCPYSIAAYLRLWNAALNRPRCDGLFATDEPDTPWSMAYPNLRPPRFYVGVRHGSQGDSEWARLARHGVQAMVRGHTESPPRIAATLWGARGRGTGYFGDELIDYHFHGRTPPALHGEEPEWRPRHDPGLLLFHVIKAPGGTGEAVTVGLGLPHGGPDQIAALP